MASLSPTLSRTSKPAVQTRKLQAILTSETTLVVVLVLIGLVAHALNMFNYPSFTIKDDEGIYAEQAWAALREGKITHYTYTYDHAPAGWLQLAVWMGLTGGAHTFGGAVDSGRVLMLLLHLAMIPMMYHLTRKLGGSPAVAGLATFIFSVSPMAVFYQRMVLLDNFMLFWFFVSANLLLDGRGRLSRLFMSGLAFGIAFLSKETIIILLPVFLYLAWKQRWQHQGRFAVGVWIVPVLMVISWYPVYAIFKGELLPNGGLNITSDNNGNPITGVSLFDALRWQATRKDDGNRLWTEIIPQDWLRRDAFLLIGGAFASVFNLVRGLFPRNRAALVVGALGFLPLYYLARGGVVFSYYIAFATPFLALNIAFLVGVLFSRLPRPASASLVSLAGISLVGLYLAQGTLQPLYTERPDQPGREAISWVKQNLPADSKIIMRDDMWADLHEADSSGPAFPDAHPYWKAAFDPAVYKEVFNNDWHNVDYLILPGKDYAYQINNNNVFLDAFKHSHLIKRWISNPGNDKLHEPQTVEIWQVTKEISTNSTDLLAGSATYLTNRFEQKGAYIGPEATLKAGSQAFAMQRAVWLNDRAAFDRAWNWTKANLFNEKGLLASQWRNGTVTDTHTSSDADTDTALALLMAGKRWNDTALIEAGTKMTKAIWDNEVTTINNLPYITAGDWGSGSTVVPFNPGYFAPYAYRVFAEVDSNHDWQGVINSGYDVLFKSITAPLGFAKSAGLPPDWIGISRENGEVEPLKLAQTDTTSYGSDAARTYWRIALDAKWSTDNRPAIFISKGTFLQDEISRKDYIGAAYAHNGIILKDSPSVATTAGTLAVLMTIDSNRAETMYRDQIAGGVRKADKGYFWNWSSVGDLDSNEWGWFATALYNNALPNLWQTGGK